MTLKTYVEESRRLSVGILSIWTLTAAPITGQERFNVESRIIVFRVKCYRVSNALETELYIPCDPEICDYEKKSKFEFSHEIRYVCSGR